MSFYRVVAGARMPHSIIGQSIPPIGQSYSIVHLILPCLVSYVECFLWNKCNWVTFTISPPLSLSHTHSRTLSFSLRKIFLEGILLPYTRSSFIINHGSPLDYFVYPISNIPTNLPLPLSHFFIFVPLLRSWCRFLVSSLGALSLVGRVFSFCCFLYPLLDSAFWRNTTAIILFIYIKIPSFAFCVPCLVFFPLGPLFWALVILVTFCWGRDKISVLSSVYASWGSLVEPELCEFLVDVFGCWSCYEF